MSKNNAPSQFIAGTSVVSMKVYENEAAAKVAVARSLNAHLKKVLIDWAKQVDIIQANNRNDENDMAPPSLPECFDEEAKKIVTTTLQQKINNLAPLNLSRRLLKSAAQKFKKEKLSHPDSFYEEFAAECTQELKKKKRELLYQGSATLVFYKEGEYVRGLKPSLDPKGLNAKVNENVRIIGSENQFTNKNGVKYYARAGFNKVKTLIGKPEKVLVPRLMELNEEKIIWGDREGVLLVYEKAKNAVVGEKIRKALSQLIEETSPKINGNSVSNRLPKVNLGSAIYTLQELVNKTPGLLSCHFYFIDEKEDSVIHYTAKQNTLDPIESALLASEEMTELLVETKISTNYHLKKLILGSLKNVTLDFLRVLPLFLVTIVLFVCSTFFPLSGLSAAAFVALTLGLISLIYFSYKSMSQLIEETKPTHRFGEVTLTKLEESDFSNVFSNKISKLREHIFIDHKKNQESSSQNKEALINSQNRVLNKKKSTVEQDDTEKLHSEVKSEKPKKLRLIKNLKKFVSGKKTFNCIKKYNLDQNRDNKVDSVEKCNKTKRWRLKKHAIRIFSGEEAVSINPLKVKSRKSIFKKKKNNKKTSNLNTKGVKDFFNEAFNERNGLQENKKNPDFDYNSSVIQPEIIKDNNPFAEDIAKEQAHQKSKNYKPILTEFFKFKKRVSENTFSGKKFYHAKI